ncbi:hypothetical protein T484DRAFT_1781524 [Baffinella frigidus]|nr:hypothetical protein T484DRAFT_1781524 [Cryptophyta sp. CCMP2293]
MATEGTLLILRYWDCRGRGEPIRLLLADALGDPVVDAAAQRPAGLAWVDEYVVLASARETWPAAKSDPAISGVHGTLPVLEWDGFAINQTLACATAAAAAVGRSGDGPHAMTRGLSVAQLCYEDLSVQLFMAVWERPGKDAAFVRGSGREGLNVAGKLLILENITASISPCEFLGGELPGIGDVFVLTAVDAVVYVFGEEGGKVLLEPCPALRPTVGP